MKLDVVFIIRIREPGAEFGFLITEPEVWTSDFHDRTCWEVSDIESAVKLAFLFNLKHEYLTEEEARLVGIDDQLRVDTFDRYWTLESFLGIDNRLEDVIATMAPYEVKSENAYLNSRIDWHRARKHSNCRGLETGSGAIGGEGIMAVDQSKD